MPDSLQKSNRQISETNIEEIAEELKSRRKQGQRTTLFLGSRTGGLFGNEYLYETLKQFSLLNFDTLSNIDKFRECYSVLKHFTEMERHNILVGALATLRYREEDKLLAELIRTGFFETIITTNIDSLLEEACSLWRSDFRLIVPTIEGVPAIEQSKSRSSTIIKIFGDLEARHYYTASEPFNLYADDRLRKFLRSRLRKDVLIVGYDAVWDQAIQGAFPLNGGMFWYVNEPETIRYTELTYILKHRNGKLFQNKRGGYSDFIKILYDSLGEDANRHEIAAEPLPPLLQPLAKNKKKVFISYSRKDKKYLERLKIHLEGYLYQFKDIVALWEDTNILPGTDWKEEIKKAVTQAEVAILLISANNLSSEFVDTHEISSLILDTARKQNVTLLSIILDSSLSLFNEREQLSQYRVMNTSLKPLKDMQPDEREIVWKKLAERVYTILRS